MTIHLTFEKYFSKNLQTCKLTALKMHLSAFENIDFAERLKAQMIHSQYSDAQNFSPETQLRRMTHLHLNNATSLHQQRATIKPLCLTNRLCYAFILYSLPQNQLSSIRDSFPISLLLAQKRASGGKRLHNNSITHTSGDTSTQQKQHSHQIILRNAE